MEAQQLLSEINRAFDGLRPTVIMPADGFIKHDYLVPGGFYKQMWDWDGFFIGCHLASRSQAEAQYLRGWVQNFVNGADAEGYVPGCITTEGVRPLFGKFAMKPFLAQGAYFAALHLEDWAWLAPIYDDLKRITAYRELTQYDADYGLFFWDNAMQSGADNNPALTNDENDREAILACDVNAFQLREYLALQHIAEKLEHDGGAAQYAEQAEQLQSAMLRLLWFADDATFYNIRRDTGLPVRCVSYSNFIPLMQGIASQHDGKAMIERYLWNEDHMLSPYGLRTLSKQDASYNNVNMIIPYSNWQGPVWPIANYLYSVALKRYGFDAEAVDLAQRIGKLCLEDVQTCGSMHENYHADTSEPLAPTAEQSAGGVFTGFVGWNLLVQNMMQGAVNDDWLLLEL